MPSDLPASLRFASAIQLDDVPIAIRRGALRDATLSLRARGLLACLLATPDEQTLTLSALTATAPDGEDATRAALTELLQHGYVTPVAGPDGTCMQCGDRPLQHTPMALAASPGQVDPPPARAVVALQKPVSSTKARGTRLPEDWQPSPELLAWAAEQFPNVDAHAETEAFRDYWLAVAGAKARKTHWNLTWRNWIRRARPRTKLTPQVVLANRKSKTLSALENLNAAYLGTLNPAGLPAPVDFARGPARLPSPALPFA